MGLGFSGGKFQFNGVKETSSNVSNISQNLNSSVSNLVDNIKEKLGGNNTTTEIVDINGDLATELFAADKALKEQAELKKMEEELFLMGITDLSGEDYKRLYDAGKIDTKSSMTTIPGTRMFGTNPFFGKDEELASGNFNYETDKNTTSVDMNQFIAANMPNTELSNISEQTIEALQNLNFGEKIKNEGITPKAEEGKMGSGVYKDIKKVGSFSSEEFKSLIENITNHNKN